MGQVLGVILAGGLSRRMGGPEKAFVTLEGKPLAQHVAERLASQVDRVIVNANGDAERFASLGLPVVADSVDGFAGPLAGVLAGLDHAARLGVDQIVSVAVDTPNFPRDLVSRLIERGRVKNAPIVLAATRGEDGRLLRHPTFGLWPVALREDLRQALEGGLRKVVLWTEAHGGVEEIFEAKGADPFFNINTPDDLLEAQNLLKRNPT